MAVTSASKWSCPSCTYNNWQSWSKCVLCGSSKPTDDVIPRTPVAKYRQQNPGWSKLGSSHPGGVGASLSPGNKCLELTPTSPTVESSHPNVAQKGSAKCKTKGKWMCGSCTYLNWPNAGQCTICGAPRSKPTRNDALARNEPGRMASRSSESILLYASGVGAVGGASASGSCDVPLHSAKAKNGRHGNRGGGQGAANGENRKWKCQHCTYENWPRASKCTMCLRAKTRTPSPPLSGTEDSTLTPVTPPLSSSPHSLHGRVSSQAQPSSPHFPTPQPTPLNSNTSLVALSPVPRAHSNSNDTCEAHSNSNETDVGVAFNTNKHTSSSNMQPGKDILTDPGSKSVRERRISERYNSLLKSDTDEVCGDTILFTWRWRGNCG